LGEAPLTVTQSVPGSQIAPWQPCWYFAVTGKQAPLKEEASMQASPAGHSLVLSLQPNSGSVHILLQTFAMQMSPGPQ
jgi:hypothetical protein